MEPKKVFLIGLIGVAATSAVSEFAVNQGKFYASLALQAIFAVLLALAALAIISVTLRVSA